MSFSFQQQATPASITTTTSGTATFANAPQEGELIVAVLAINSSTATITPPAGFSVKNEYKNTSRSLGIYFKKAGASESTGYTFNFSASVSGTIMMRRYSSSIGWDTDQSGGATDKVWDSTGTVSQVSLNLTTTLNRLLVGIGYASNTTASNKQLNPNSGWSDNTLQYSSRSRSAHRIAAGGSEALGYQLTDSTLDNRLAFMVAEFVEYVLKNAVAGSKTLALSWNDRRYSDPSKAPAIDTTPDAFSFTDQTNVALNSTITSAAITVSGINSAATITSSGGTFDINSSGTFISSGNVNNGDTVRARVTSSSSNSTAANCVVTIGGVSDTFTVTTVASSTYTPFKKADFSGGTVGAAASGSNAFAVPAIRAGTNSQTLFSSDIAGPYGESRICAVGQSTGDGLFGGTIDDSVQSVVNGNELWVRVWHYFPTGFSFGNAGGGDASDALKWLRLQWGTNDGAGNRSTLQLYTAKTIGLLIAEIPQDGYRRIFPTQTSIPLNQWVCLEWYIKFGTRVPSASGTGTPIADDSWAGSSDETNYKTQANAGLIRAWVNGVFCGERGVPTMPNNSNQGNLTGVYLGDYWNGGAPANQKFYVGNIIITRQTPSATDSGGRPMIGTAIKVSDFA